MECINGYIGVKGCPGAEAPASGMFINHLPGISFKSLAGITDFDANTVSQVWEQIQTLAGEMLVADVTAGIRFKYSLKTSRRTVSLSPVYTGDTYADDGTEKGMVMDLGLVKSQFNHIYVSMVRLRLESLPTADGYGISTVDIVFRDKEGTELSRITQIVDAAMVGTTITIPVLKSFTTDYLFAGFIGDGLGAYGSTITNEVHNSFCYTVCQICPDCEPVVTGATAMGGDYETGTDTFGLTVVAGIGCSYRNIVCANLEWFTMPLLYLCGYLIMIERLTSDRVNKWTTVGTQQAEELRDTYREEYERRLKDVMTGMELDSDHDCCIDCTQAVKRKVYLP